MVEEQQLAPHAVDHTNARAPLHAARRQQQPLAPPALEARRGPRARRARHHSTPEIRDREVAAGDAEAGVAAWRGRGGGRGGCGGGGWLGAAC